MFTTNYAVNIILADDDDDDRSIFMDAFAELEIPNHITLFSSADELLEYLNTTAIEQPQLLFLDLNMPCKGGLQCLREIRRNEKLNKLSIAIYSTSSSESEIANTFASGANLYIVKPCDYSKLKTIISKVVHSDLKGLHPGNWQSYVYTV